MKEYNKYAQYFSQWKDKMFNRKQGKWTENKKMKKAKRKWTLIANSLKPEKENSENKKDMMISF